MRRTWKVSMGIALVSVAVVASAAAPVFGQRGGRRGRGASGEDFGSQGDPSGGGRGRGGFRGMGDDPGQFPGGGGPPGMFPGGGGPQGDFRGRGGPPSGDARGQGRGFQGPFGGADGGERLERFLREMDADGDGRIEENEVDGRRRNLLEMMARQAGIELRLPMPVARLRDALNNASRQRGGESPSGRPEEGAGRKPAVEPLVPGFGVEMDLTPVLYFGERPDSSASGKTRSAVVSASRSGLRSSSSPSAAPRRGNSDERMRGGAEAMMRQADQNGNGRLEPNEWNERWGDFREADRNRDGAVTVDELAQRLSGFARRGPGGDRGGSANPSGSASSSGSEGAGSGSGSGSPQQPKSYRVPTPTELLPAGLPDWFAQKDANADGQVAMAEFESPRSWTAAAVAEFRRFDPNNDGFITPTECLNILNPAGAGSQLARAEVASQGPPAPGPSAAPAPGPESRPAGPVTRGDQGRSTPGMRGRGQQSDRRGGMPGPRDRESQASRRGESGPAPGGGMGDAWAGF